MTKGRHAMWRMKFFLIPGPIIFPIILLGLYSVFVSVFVSVFGLDAAPFISPVHGQSTRYISDTLEVPLRAGTSTRYKILRMLKSGTSLTVLSKASENGYSKVRTEGGTQGWVLSRYLMDTPSARESLARAQQALAPLQQENANLTQQIAILQKEKDAVENALGKIERENEQLSQSLSQIRKTSANAITIDERNKKLEQQMVAFERQLQLLQQENLALRDNSNQTWFIRGAGVLLFGLVLGVVLPRLRFRKNSRWGDL